MSPAALPARFPKINFIWAIHIACNYRCSYCTWQLGLWDGKGWEVQAQGNRYPEFESLVALWDAVYERYGSVHIDVDTGEPTTYPRFLDLAVELTKKHSISITTNLSRDMDFWREFVARVGKSVYMTVSFHPQFTKPEPFIEKVLFLQQHNVIKVVCVAWPPHVPKLVEYKRLFKERGISFRVQAYWGPYEGKSYPDAYTAEEKDMIRSCSEDLENIFRTQAEYQLMSKQTEGRPCHAGQVFALINNDGNVFRCSSVRGASLGNIYDGTFQLFEGPRPCPVKSCLCEWKFLADLNEREVVEARAI